MKKLFLTLSLMFFSTVSLAENKIEFTVMHGPGGVSDIVTREINKELNFNVVNRPGAGGRIAMRNIVSNPSISLATMSQIYVTNPLNFKDLEYDPYLDLELIGVAGVMPSILVCNKKVGIKNFREFLQNEKSLTFAVGGYGSSEHLNTEVLLSKITIKHTVVSYAQGGGKAVLDLLGGHVNCMFSNFPAVKPYLQHENLNFILLSHNVPGVAIPTWEKEFKQSFPLQSFLGVIISSKIDEKLKIKIQKDLSSVLNSNELKNRLEDIGLFPKTGTSDSLLKEAIDNNQKIKKFIIDNKINVSG